MSYNPAIGRFLERDPIEYDDGMNLYEFVGGNPIRYVDPIGLFSVDTTNPDIKRAFAELENSRAGQHLLEDISRLEACAKKTVRVILSPAPNSSTVTNPGKEEIQVWMNPFDQVGAFPNGTASHNIITGPMPNDFRIGTELDALLYHELQHALFYLIQSCGEKYCIKVGEGIGPEGSKGWLEEEARITRLENEYRREKGYPQRNTYGASDDQIRRINEQLARGVRGQPISGPPDFRGEQLQRERERRQRQGTKAPG